MKKRYYILTAIFSYLALLIITVPASSLSKMVNDNSPVSIQGVSGTLWNGEAYIITINNKVRLNNTEWSVSFWKLFLGQLAIDVNSHHSDNAITAELGSSFLGRFFINNLTAKLSAEDAAQIADIPLVKLSGLISLNIENAHWKQGELPQASGTINWSDAIVTVAESASLGNVSIVLGESEQHLLNADIKNQGGDIKLSGTAKLIPEADYSVNIVLTPTASASDNIKNSLGLFAKKQRNGEFHLNNSGSLNTFGLI